MSEIEEGDQVVTTEGEVDQVVRVTEIPDPCGPQVWLKERKLHLGQDKLIRVDQPLRVRVSREKQAEDIVALARESGFRAGQIKRGCDIYELNPDVKTFVRLHRARKHDLTYRDDLPQIEAWLECHSESEDECDVRTCTDGYVMGQGHIHPCPECNPDVKCEVCEDQDCTDESDVEENFNPCDGEPLKSNTDEFDNTMSVDDDDERWIQNESEEYDEPRPEDEKLQDVREELFHKENYIQRLRERLNNSRKALRNNQERIEEARGWLQKGWDEGRHRTALKKALEILPPDSDEGDGSEEKHA